MSDEPEDRKPRSVYGVGEDPDVRFSMANERTALAWVRTGLAIIAGGVALITLASVIQVSPVFMIFAAIACLAGGAVAGSAIVSWRRAERAMRQGLPLPPPVALPWLVGGVVVLAIALSVVAIVEASRL
jgi:putative membrane protein